MALLCIGSVVHGMMCNVVGSGLSIMSDSFMVLKPRTDDPSKPMPEVSTCPSVKCLAGITTSCIRPRMSTKAVCTHRILFFFRVSLAWLIASMLFTIHSVESQFITFLYINFSNNLKESLYISLLNEQVFTTKQKSKLLHG